MIYYLYVQRLSKLLLISFFKGAQDTFYYRIIISSNLDKLLVLLDFLTQFTTKNLMNWNYLLNSSLSFVIYR